MNDDGDDDSDSSDDEDMSLGALQQKQQKRKKLENVTSAKKQKSAEKDGKSKHQNARVCTACLCRSLSTFLVENGGEQEGKALFVEKDEFARWMKVAMECSEGEEKCSAPAATEKLKLGCTRLKTSFRRGQKGDKLKVRLQPVVKKSPSKAPQQEMAKAAAAN